MGGPSQELAARVARELSGEAGWGLWAFSTDGRDGPSEGAGGVVDGGTWERVRAVGGDPERMLEEHDSTGLLRMAGGLIARRVTGTNLNHVAVLMGLAGGKS